MKYFGFKNTLKRFNNKITRRFFIKGTHFFRPLGHIFNYHRIICETSSFGPDRYAVKPSVLESQIKYLKSSYVLTSPDTFSKAVSSNTEPDKTKILITFDDGYKDFRTNAMPVLREHKVPVLLFVTTGFLFNRTVNTAYVLFELLRQRDRVNCRVGSRDFSFRLKTLKERQKAFSQLHPVLKGKKAPARKEILKRLAAPESPENVIDQSIMLNSSELKRLNEDPLVTIGLHGRKHVPLTLYDQEELYEELRQAKSEIESLLKEKINYFAYPYGKVNALIINVLEKLNLKMAFTTEARAVYSWDRYFPYQIPRRDGSDFRLSQ